MGADTDLVLDCPSVSVAVRVPWAFVKDATRDADGIVALKVSFRVRLAVNDSKAEWVRDSVPGGADFETVEVHVGAEIEGDSATDNDSNKVTVSLRAPADGELDLALIVSDTVKDNDNRPPEVDAVIVA